MSVPKSHAELVAAVCTAQRSAWRQGKGRLIESFIDEHPELLGHNEALLDLIYGEFCLREELGEQLEPREYFQRFPQYAEQLAPLLALHSAVEAALVEPYGEHSDPEQTRPLDRGPEIAKDLSPAGGGTLKDIVGSERTQRLGKFELLSVCGQGAFGTVYRALDTNIGRVVALKLPRTGRLSTTEDEDRFLREAKAVAQLRDERIVSVYEAGRIDGTPYIASEFVDGESVAEVLARRELSVNESVCFVQQIAMALHVAHQMGIVHRDIKPANVMLIRQAAAHNPPRDTSEHLNAQVGKPAIRVMDFGLAHRDAAESYFTLEGQILGTPCYMSPEQARGDSYRVDGRSDVFSLGAVFYEMLTGQKPFQGNLRMVLEQVLDSDPQPVRRLVDTVPPDLETICLRCLEKAPERRYQSAKELADELTRFQHNVPILARPVTSFERLVKWCQRHRLVSGLIGGILIVLLMGISATTWQLLATLEAERSRTLAQLNLLQDAPPAVVPSLLDELAGYMSQVGPEVRRRLSNKQSNNGSQRRRLLLLVSRRDTAANQELFQELFVAPFSESELIARELATKLGEDELELSKEILKDEEHTTKALRAALLISKSSHKSDNWLEGTEEFFVSAMIDEVLAHTDEYETVERVFSPVRQQLTSELEKVALESDANESRRRIATMLLGSYMSDNIEELLSLILQAQPWQLPVLFADIPVTQRQYVVNESRRLIEEYYQTPSISTYNPHNVSNAALLLTYFDGVKQARRVLINHPNRAARSYYIDGYRKAALEPKLVINWLPIESDSFAKAALLHILGTFRPEDLAANFQTEAENLVDTTLTETQSTGCWSAALWVRRSWRNDTDYAAVLDRIRNSRINTVEKDTVILGPNAHIFVKQEKGELPVDPGKRRISTGSQGSQDRRRIVSRAFALSMFETTIAQYRQFEPSWSSLDSDAKDENCPVYSISAQKAAEYCNWLSEQAELPRDQWCYVSSSSESRDLMSAPDYLDRRGYRLPTETEWEYACRSGSTTDWHFGEGAELIRNYAWCPTNSPLGLKHPVGLKTPNDAGFFDLYGNADEICDDEPDQKYTVRPGGYFVTRGGAAGDLISPGSKHGNLAANDTAFPGPVATGFRVCRSVIDSSPNTTHEAN